MTAPAKLRKQDDVLRLVVPEGKSEVVYFDNGDGRTPGARGLALRVRANGTRSYLFFYNRKKKSPLEMLRLGHLKMPAPKRMHGVLRLITAATLRKAAMLPRRRETYLWLHLVQRSRNISPFVTLL